MASQPTGAEDLGIITEARKEREESVYWLLCVLSDLLFILGPIR